MIVDRGMFPSPTYRQCTSDLKRGPIERTIRRTNRKLIVNCMGMRAQESSSRAKLTTFKLNKKNSKAGREWHDWLPVFDLKIEEVFATIAGAGQKPHWVYAEGMTRMSCKICIMSSQADLVASARIDPDNYAEYVYMERLTGQTMRGPVKGVRKTLEDITGIKASESGLAKARARLSEFKVKVVF